MGGSAHPTYSRSLPFFREHLIFVKTLLLATDSWLPTPISSLAAFIEMLPFSPQGCFILKKTSLLTLVVPRMPTPPIHDLLGIWWDWGSHGGIGAATAGLGQPRRDGGSPYKRMKQPCFSPSPASVKGAVFTTCRTVATTLHYLDVY